MVSTPRAGSAEADRTDGTDGGSRTGLLGAAVAGFAAGAIGYLALERRGSGPSLPAGADVREAAAGVRESVGDVREAVPIGEGDEDAAGAGGDAEPADVSLETPSTDRSARELRERASEDAEAEPAEPGEMTVDDDVVDEVLDEEGT